MRIRVRMEAYMDVPVENENELDDYMENNFFFREEKFMKLVKLGHDDTGWDTEWEKWDDD